MSEQHTCVTRTLSEEGAQTHHDQLTGGEKLELLKKLQQRISSLTESAALSFDRNSIGNEFQIFNEKTKNSDTDTDKDKDKDTDSVEDGDLRRLLNFMEYSFSLDTNYSIEMVKLLSFAVLPARPRPRPRPRPSDQSRPRNVDPHPHPRRRHRDLSEGSPSRAERAKSRDPARAAVTSTVHLVAAVDSDGDVTAMRAAYCV